MNHKHTTPKDKDYEETELEDGEVENVEDLIKAHNTTQWVWVQRLQKIWKKLGSLEKNALENTTELSTVRELIEGPLEDEISSVSKSLKKKEETNGKTRIQVLGLQKSVDLLRDEVADSRRLIEANRKERREDIEKLGELIEQKFKDAQKERSTENAEIIKNTKERVSDMRNIIVPLIVFSLGLFFYHMAGGKLP